MSPSSLTLDHPADDGLPNFTHQQIVSVLVGIMLCIVLSAVDITVVVPAVPAIAADLHGFGHLSWIVSAYLITSTAAMPIYAKLSDIYGRRRLLMIAIVLFVATSIFCALSQSLVVLIACRAIQGIGGGGLVAVSQTVVADIVAPRERGRYQGYMAGSWGAASIFGPILGGWITDSLSWHWIFWINAPIGIAALFLCNRPLKLLKPQKGKPRIDYLGAALLTALTTACLLVLSWGGSEYPWMSAPILAIAGLALMLLVLLYIRESLAPDPILPPRILARAEVGFGILTAALATAAMLGGTFLLPLFYQLVGGATAAAAGTLLMPFLGLNSLGAFLSGRLARRLGRVKMIVVVGCVGAAAGFFLLATMTGATGPLLSVVYASVCGFFIGSTMPATMVMAQNAADRRDVGVVTGAFLFLRSMGGAFGSTLVGALLIGIYNGFLAGKGIAQHIDLAALRGGSALQQPDPAMMAISRSGLTEGFHGAFIACGVMTAIAAVVCAFLRDIPLQSATVRDQR
ncbi:MAG TPA: MDR family MFS transporter [Dongiaceae bacterium]|jgi:EmrB/QacA subfamily drug resistance transporter|nr:MDR family MFS transporter [Dongiaceae bacterium]